MIRHAYLISADDMPWQAAVYKRQTKGYIRYCMCVTVGERRIRSLYHVESHEAYLHVDCASLSRYTLRLPHDL
jgi:hypothetical protein